ncbi:MAG: thiol-disulfide isomerase and thioredoxin [Gammaproteobacteria bacterium]|jgi:thiol-disulfide isomerase/thioredoxin|nr:thiol-disulfide isomerase and thioredoxin [Gammaproteobacteria bacterium]
MMRARRARALNVLLICTWALLEAPSNAEAPLDLNRFSGQVVYLDFWASWCAPCRQSFPWMAAMNQAYARQGLTVVAVNLDHERADADGFLQKFHPDFDVRFDPQGALAERFKVVGMPTSVVIDRKGVPRFTHVGFRVADRDAYEAELRALLAEK